MPFLKLPTVLPVFPLTGCILLPGNWLPLHVFEPRYRALVSDVLAGDRIMGMIQPLVPATDNAGPAEGGEENPDLHAVGCAGVIVHALPEPDGRYHILLKGESRFRVQREAQKLRGYRRLEVSYQAFQGDPCEMGQVLDPSRILRALQVLKDSHSLSIDPDDFRNLGGVAILNGLSAALPFTPGEKQALLEAAGIQHRERLLLGLMALGFGHGTGSRFVPPSTIH
ncbi:MAG TPA: LON peptidase substrate-binding domain-containing protein [Candidatus Polarisedimenticolia bacterium]|nr:LON peptidase substrate-binding domain-containing protein [Candidatus Polarisedimenticolia bacterium]